MTLEDVSAPAAEPKPAPGSPAPAAGGDKEKPKDDAAALRAENAELKRTNQELSKSERYWAGRAQGGKTEEPETEDEPEPKPKAGAEDDDDLDDPAKFVEALSAKGAKHIDKLLKKRGYVSREEAAELAKKESGKAVEKARRQITSDAALMSQYPELKDENSPLFKATAVEWNEMVKLDPELKKSPATLILAAKTAKLQLKAVEPETDEDEPESREAARLKRVAAQAGDRGRQRPREYDDDDSHMGPQAKAIAAALGVKDEDYVAERKKLKAGR